jgi:hypothetical protein
MFMAVKPRQKRLPPGVHDCGLVLATESHALPLLSNSFATAQRENCPANGDGEAVRNSDAVRLQEKGMLPLSRSVNTIRPVYRHHLSVDILPLGITDR